MTETRAKYNTHGGARPGSGPKLGPGGKRRIRPIKMTDGEWQAINEAAAKVGMSASEYVRAKAVPRHRKPSPKAN